MQDLRWLLWAESYSTENHVNYMNVLHASQVDVFTDDQLPLQLTVTYYYFGSHRPSRMCINTLLYSYRTASSFHVLSSTSAWPDEEGKNRGQMPCGLKFLLRKSQYAG